MSRNETCDDGAREMNLSEEWIGEDRLSVRFGGERERRGR